MRCSICLVVMLLLLALAACSPAPEVLVVEITRLVPEIEEVEVTRLVEIEKEVTRIVEVPAGAPTAGARTPESDLSGLNFLHIDLWPDFDQPAVLVLLTGELADGLAGPVDMAIPVPQNAQINAVAQIDDSGMTSIDYEVENGVVAFESETPVFRVEYYVPYQRDGSWRSYDFQWLAQFDVQELAVQIQRPANAVGVFSQPAASGVFTEPSDGLEYLILPSQPVPGGTPYNLQLDYEMSSDELTVDKPGNAPPQLPGSPLHDKQVHSG